MATLRKYSVPEGGTRFCIGGHIKQVPKPHKRWYDDKRRKRPVKITVMGFWGLGRHYYVSIKEDGNGIWNTKEKTWQECWDDPAARGQQFDKKFDNMVLAAEWVRTMTKKHFPKHTHKLSQDWDNLHVEEDKRIWLGIFKVGD